jgi:hypothetical protein
MQTLEYRTIDKTGWGEGPWLGEPDKRQWRDPATGLPCLIVRSPSGALCGYVGVSVGHPLHGVDYSQQTQLSPDLVRLLLEERSYADLYEKEAATGLAAPECLFDVHGGLTFSDGCDHGNDPSRGICHLPGPGEPDDVWWFGFDCAHAGDLCPKYERRMQFHGDVYRPQAYVEGQIASLAQQLAALVGSGEAVAAQVVNDGPGRSPQIEESQP